MFSPFVWCGGKQLCLDLVSGSTITDDKAGGRKRTSTEIMWAG